MKGVSADGQHLVTKFIFKPFNLKNLQTSTTILIYIGNRVKNQVKYIVLKCISIQVILNNVHYHKYHHHVVALTCLQDKSPVLSWAYLHAEWWPIINGARSFSMLSSSRLIQSVLLDFSVWSPNSPLPLAEFFDDPPLENLWKRDRIRVTGLHE